jgi:serine/threonine-protein kinase
MLCSKGHDNSPDSLFCRLCGEQLTDPHGSPVPPNAQSPSVLRVGVRYRIVRQLSHGGFGRTYLAEDEQRFQEQCVLKEFAPRVDDPEALLKAEQLFEREAGVLYRLKHAQIPQFRELLRAEFEGRDRLFLVQDYVSGPTYQNELDRRVQLGTPFTEPEILEFLSQILPVLAYIHDMGVIHRDIAPDNLILRETDHYPVLIDFGGVKQAATTIESELRRAQTPSPEVTLVGKQGFAPREQMQEGKVAPHCDLYALAVTVLVFMTGRSPRELLDAEASTYWERQLSDRGKIGDLLTSVLKRMLSDRPSQRYPSAQHVMAALGFLRVVTQPSASANGTNAAAVGSQGEELSASSPHASSPVATAHTVAVSPAKTRAASQPVAPRSTASSPRAAPSSQSPPQRQERKQDSAWWQGILAFFVIITLAGVGGWVGYRWIPQWLNIGQPNDVTETPDEESGQDLDLADSPLSPEEEARKAALRSRRDALGVDTAFLVKLTDAQFYETYPRQRGRQLTDGPDDAVWRERWDAIAADWLDHIEATLSAQARQRLGRYGESDRAQWKQTANRLYVSSAALYDLTDARFFHQFPDQQRQNFIDRPIGQIWHGIADDQVRSMQAGQNLQNIQFAPGTTSYERSGQLAPGDGVIYTLNAREGQRMQLNVDAPQNDVRVSLYLPRPTADLPALLEDARSLNWSGELPQSGYYEIAIVSVSNQPTRFRLALSVD